MSSFGEIDPVNDECEVCGEDYERCLIVVSNSHSIESQVDIGKSIDKICCSTSAYAGGSPHLYVHTKSDQETGWDDNLDYIKESSEWALDQCQTSDESFAEFFDLTEEQAEVFMEASEEVADGGVRDTNGGDDACDDV